MPVPELTLDFSNGLKDSAGNTWVSRPAPGSTVNISVDPGNRRATFTANGGRSRIGLDGLRIEQGSELWISCTLHLPAGFWNAAKSYHRWITLDNWAACNAIGKASEACRIGWGPWSDDGVRIWESRRNGGEETVLIPDPAPWPATRLKGPDVLPDGRSNRLDLNVILSPTHGAALTVAYVNSVQIDSFSVRPNFRPITGANYFSTIWLGLDGAAEQATPLTLSISDVRVSAKSPFTAPPPPPPPPVDPCQELRDELATVSRQLAEEKTLSDAWERAANGWKKDYGLAFDKLADIQAILDR